MDERLKIKNLKNYLRREIHEFFKKTIMEDTNSGIEYFSVHNSEYDSQSNNVDIQFSCTSLDTEKETMRSSESKDPGKGTSEKRSSHADINNLNFNYDDLPEDIKQLYNTYVSPTTEESYLNETSLQEDAQNCKNKSTGDCVRPVHSSPVRPSKNEKSIVLFEPPTLEKQRKIEKDKNKKLDIKIDLFSKKIGDQQSFYTSKNFKATASKWKIDLFDQYEKRSGLFAPEKINPPHPTGDSLENPHLVEPEKPEKYSRPASKPEEERRSLENPIEKHRKPHPEENCCLKTKMLLHNFGEKDKPEAVSRHPKETIEGPKETIEEDKEIQVSLQPAPTHTEAEETDVLGLFLDCEAKRLENATKEPVRKSVSFPKGEDQMEIFDIERMGIGFNKVDIGETYRRMRPMFDPRVDLFDIKTGGINLEIYEDLLAELDKTKLSLTCANKYIDSLRSLSEVDKNNFHKYVATLKTNHEEHLKLLILQFMDFLYSVRFNYNKKSKDLIAQLEKTEQELKRQTGLYEKKVDELRAALAAKKGMVMEKTSNHMLINEVKDKYIKVLETNQKIKNQMQNAKIRFGAFVRDNKRDLEKYDVDILKMLLEYSTSMSNIEKDLICSKEEIDRFKYLAFKPPASPRPSSHPLIFKSTKAHKPIIAQQSKQQRGPRPHVIAQRPHVIAQRPHIAPTKTISSNNSFNNENQKLFNQTLSHFQKTTSTYLKSIQPRPPLHLPRNPIRLQNTNFDPKPPSQNRHYKQIPQVHGSTYRRKQNLDVVHYVRKFSSSSVATNHTLGHYPSSSGYGYNRNKNNKLKKPSRTSTTKTHGSKSVVHTRNRSISGLKHNSHRK